MLQILVGYEEYLKAIGALDRPGLWYEARLIALAVQKDPRLVSAYLTRLHKMGLVKRKVEHKDGPGRPAFRYQLSRRGREHLRWLLEDAELKMLAEVMALLKRDPATVPWTKDLEREFRTFLRRKADAIDLTFWEMKIASFRSQCLKNPIAAFDSEWWTPSGKR